MLTKRIGLLSVVVVASLWGAAVVAQSVPAVPPAPAAPAAPAAAAAVVATPSANTPSSDSASPSSTSANTPAAPTEPSKEKDTSKDAKPAESPAEIAKDIEASESERMRDMLFESSRKDAWIALTAAEREKVLRDILPTMTFNGLSGAKLNEAVPKVNDCTGEELATPDFEGYDVATAVTKCLFKLGYAP